MSLMRAPSSGLIAFKSSGEKADRNASRRPPGSGTMACPATRCSRAVPVRLMFVETGGGSDGSSAATRAAVRRAELRERREVSVGQSPAVVACAREELTGAVALEGRKEEARARKVRARVDANDVGLADERRASSCAAVAFAGLRGVVVSFALGRVLVDRIRRATDFASEHQLHLPGARRGRERRTC
eukprot:scaffold103266_cov66-Phaeocystis_antarctica.AAC.13